MKVPSQPYTLYTDYVHALNMYEVPLNHDIIFKLSTTVDFYHNENQQLKQMYRMSNGQDKIHIQTLHMKEP